MGAFARLLAYLWNLQRLSQYWVMYASVGTQTSTSQLIGTTPSGQLVDLYRYISTRQVVEPLASDTIVYDMSRRFPSPRWERAIAQWSNGKDRSGKKAKVLCRALCHLLHPPPSDNDSSLEFASVELQYKMLHILPPGSALSYEEEEQQQAGTNRVRDVKVFRVNCSATAATGKEEG